MEQADPEPTPVRRTVAFFPAVEHLDPNLAVVEALVAGGLRVVAFGERLAQSGVEAVGAEFVDIYAGETALDYDVGRPLGLNYVTFAGERGEMVARLAEAYRPFVVVLDAFATVGRVVATALQIPYVNLFSGHNRHGGNVEDTWRRPDLRITDRCTSALAHLREVYDIGDDSPFLYLPRASPYLNLYPEPPEWLPRELRAPFEPVRFFGCLLSGHLREDNSRVPLFSGDAQLRVYAAFGGQVRWPERPEAVTALEAVIDAVESQPGAELLMGLGGRGHDGLEQRTGERVQVATNAEQWRALAEADVFVTHHGMKSTHEACFHQVPMVSYPISADQPGLARRAQELNVAIPLTSEVRGPVDARKVLAAIERVREHGAVMRSGLARARRWEEEVVAGRAVIAEEIAAL